MPAKNLKIIVVMLAFACASNAQNNVDNYNQTLQALDNTHPESVCKARDSLRSYIPKASLTERAEMFRAFRTFYLKALLTTEPEFTTKMKPFVDDIEVWFMKSESSDPLPDLLRRRPDIRKASAGWFNCGFSVMEGEGDLYPAQDPASFLEFAGKLPGGLDSYIRFRAKEDAEIVAGDAALEITWAQLRMRLERWENFAHAHPELIETKSEIQPQLQWLITAFLFGMDNTPTFDYETGDLDPKLVDSWKAFAQRDQASQYHALLSALVSRLGDHQQTITIRDRPLFEQYGLTEQFDTWWRGFQIRRKRG